MLNQKLEFLLVEDNAAYRETAMDVFSKKKLVDIDSVRDYNEALSMIKKRKYDGAILDLFFPEKTGSGNKEIMKGFLPEIKEVEEKWSNNSMVSESFHLLTKDIQGNNEYEQPLGFVIGKELASRKIPSVLVSSACFGHGRGDNYFYALQRIRNLFDKEKMMLGIFVMPGYEIRDAISYDTAEKYGKDFKDQGNQNDWREILIENVVDKAEKKGIDLSNQLRNMFLSETLGRNAIEYGLLKPIKGQKTYETAYHELIKKIFDVKK